MTQHVMLLTIAAPLIVLGSPWSSNIWRPLPLGFRRTVAKTDQPLRLVRSRCARWDGCFRGRFRCGWSST